MSLFLDIAAYVSMATSISGWTLRDFLNRGDPDPSDKKEIERYLTFLEGRQVLFAEFHDEHLDAVIKSLQSIKDQTEQLRMACNESGVKDVLLTILQTLSVSLKEMHSIDPSDSRGNFKFFVALQRTRFDLARSLAMLCAWYQIEPKNSDLRKLVLDFSVKPRSKK